MIYLLWLLSFLNPHAIPQALVTARSSGGGSVTFNQAGNCNANGNCTISLTFTAGDTLYGAVGDACNSQTFGISDTVNGSWPSANAVLCNSSGRPTQQQTFHILSSASGAATITCSNSSVAVSTGCVVLEFHTPNHTRDQFATGTGNVGGLTTWTIGAGTPTTTVANEMIAACGSYRAQAGPFTAGSGYTLPTGGSTIGMSVTNMGCEYQIVSSAGVYTATITVTSGRPYTMQEATYY